MEGIEGGKSCFVQGTVLFFSTIASLGGTGFTGGLSWGLTFWAAAEYVACQDANIHGDEVYEGSEACEE